MQRIIPLIALAAVAVTAGTPAHGQGVSRIGIDTDRSVNCATLQTIVDDVTAGCKSDQEKCIALFNFVIRVMFIPYDASQPREMRRGKLDYVNDPLKHINVYGCGGCGAMSQTFHTLCHTAGFKTRHLNPGFGHASGEVFWGGKWRWMDVWYPAYVLDPQGEVASYADIQADKSLITDAVAEGRASANWMMNYKQDIGAILRAKGWKGGGQWRWNQKYVENLSLRPGESVTWLWDNVGKWYFPNGNSKKGFPGGPAFKFTKDRKFKEAFPFWEPYKKTIKDGPHAWSDVYYRYYGNAIFECRPKLTVQGLKDIGAKLDGVDVLSDGGLRAGRSGGTVELAFAPAYVIADAEVALGVNGKAAVTFSIDNGKSWLPAVTQSPAGEHDRFGLGKPNTFEWTQASVTGRYGYRLRIRLAENSTLEDLSVTTTTMLGFYSRPQLEVGENKVTVTAETKAFKDMPLKITWKWLEDWTDEKSFAHDVTESGATCVINVGGTKRPKMKSITIACPAR